MCGFAGEYVFGDALADLTTVRAMAARLVHRGPDQEGSYLSPDGKCAIGFRRLAILDIEGSRQPMTDSASEVVVAFNGEIYNYREIRANLRSYYSFATEGDTEVLLPLYLRKAEAMVESLDGMFAFVIYDARRRSLLLARDRMGKKPLWYAVLKDRILFASEAKALLAHPLLRPRRNDSATIFYLSMGYVPAPASMFAGVQKLPPACTLQVDRAVQEPRRYWSPRPEPMPPWRDKVFNHARDAITQAVKKRLHSDVRLGALLSGGVDSSIIVALMAKAAGKGAGVPTFTAGFSDADYDERPAAAEVAAFCRTDHTELLVEPPTAHVVDRIIDMYDEPFGDSSALPMSLICQAARQYVTVALCGDGGDESFAGYDRYRAMHLAATMGPLKYLGVRLSALLAAPFAGPNESSKARRLIRFASGLPYRPDMQYFTYRRLLSSKQITNLLTEEFATGVDLEAPANWFCDLYNSDEPWTTELARSQRHDVLTYLPDDLLVKADISSMAASLELRSPLLDPAVVSWGLNLPPQLKIDRHHSKLMLRHLFGPMVPESVWQRRKHGFSAPIGRWLRGPLANTLKDTLLDRRVADLGIFERDTMIAMVADHLTGRRELGQQLWSLMVLARWLLRYP